MTTPNEANDHGLFQASLEESSIPSDVDRRTFMMRNAVYRRGGRNDRHHLDARSARRSGGEGSRAAKAGDHALPDLEVVKQSKGPVMTVLEEFYKVGPGPSSSHTIGPMRITYDFYQRCTKLPAARTGEGHRTEGSPLRQPERHRQGARHRARLAGRSDRQRAGHGRPAVPGRDDRQAGADLSGQARRQDVQSLARRHHLRRHQWQLSSTRTP